jgi:hypothetical protein
MVSKATILAAAAALALMPAAAGAAANLLSNDSFERPPLSTGDFHYYNRTVHYWAYSGNAVLINAANPAPGGSLWWPDAPCPPGYGGVQFAGVQETGSISQAFTVPATGDYDLRWLAGGRPVSPGDGGDQTYEIKIDGVVVGKPHSTTSGEVFTPQHHALSGLTAGVHTLTFQGLNTSDDTAFIDDVRIVAR